MNGLERQRELEKAAEEGRKLNEAALKNVARMNDAIARRNLPPAPSAEEQERRAIESRKQVERLARQAHKVLAFWELAELMEKAK